MLKYNNDNIITGYIKQLLAAFNLPKCRIYTAANRRYHDWAVAERERLRKHSKPYDHIPLEDASIIPTIKAQEQDGTVIYNPYIKYINYIKDGQLQRYVDGTWERTQYVYYYNKKDINKTKNLKIKSNIYDSYTHEYLGDYLRFQRDYNGIDLMPLYNCFSDTLCSQLDLSFNYYTVSSDDGEKIEKTTVKFNTNDTHYKIYMLPVKLFQKYTIAIDCSGTVELCCGCFGKYYDNRSKLSALPIKTYKKYNNLKFNNPILYDKLCNTAELNIQELALNETNLKLFIKIPFNNNSSITVLEGNYLSWSDAVYNKPWVWETYEGDKLIGSFGTGWERKSNRFITNYETFSVPGEAEGESATKPPVEDREFIPYTDLQLLRANTGVSHPFADRLIEYLVGNAIDSTEDIEDNIRRVRKVMEQNGWTFDYSSGWQEKMRRIIYDYMTDKAHYIPSEYVHDTLGYVDKDAERFYTSWKLETRKDKNGNAVQKNGEQGNPEYYQDNVAQNTISNIDLYEEIYQGED